MTLVVVVNPHARPTSTRVLGISTVDRFDMVPRFGAHDRMGSGGKVICSSGKYIRYPETLDDNRADLLLETASLVQGVRFRDRGEEGARGVQPKA